MGESLHDAGDPAARRRHRGRQDKDGSSKTTRRPDDQGENEDLFEIRKKRGRSNSKSWSPSSPISSTSFSNDSLPSDESSDEERRGKNRKRETKKRKRRHTGSEKNEPKYHKSSFDKREKKHHREILEKHDSETEKKRRLLKNAKRHLKKLKQHEVSYSSEIQVSGRKVEKISVDDYFLKSHEFSSWLKEHCEIYFSDLSSKETHKFFETFVKKWNAGRLHPKYYDGIKQAPRTSYNWAIKKGPEDTVIVDRHEHYAVTMKNDKSDSNKFRKEKEILLEEIPPKSTGREIKRYHVRAREDSREKFVMDGGGDLRERVAAEMGHREKKKMENVGIYTEKRLLHESKEAAAMEQLRAFVTSAGEKIIIAKRH